MSDTILGYLTLAIIAYLYLGAFWLFHSKNKIINIFTYIINILVIIHFSIIGYSVIKHGGKSRFYPEYLNMDHKGKTWDQVNKDDPRGYWTFVTTARLNLRDKPSLKGKVVYVFDKGEELIVRSPSGEKGDWLLVETIDLEYKGFSHKNYLRAVDDKLKIGLTGKYLINIGWELIKNIFSLVGLISILITIVCSVVIYYARNQNEKWMELITIITNNICFIITRRLFYGFEQLMLIGMEIWIYFIISIILGILIWKIIYLILSAMPKYQY